MFGLNKWFSCNKKNIKICTKVQKYLDSNKVNPTIIKYLLFYKIKKDNPFIEFYLKKNKKMEDKKFDFLKKNIKEMYDISYEEFNNFYWKFIYDNLKDKTFVEYIVKYFGLNEDECKKLNFKVKKINDKDVFDKEVDLFG